MKSRIGAFLRTTHRSSLIRVWKGNLRMVRTSRAVAACIQGHQKSIEEYIGILVEGSVKYEGSGLYPYPGFRVRKRCE